MLNDNKFYLIKNKLQISKGCKVSTKAQIIGKVFLGEHVSVGNSKIFAEGEHIISISKDTTIKDKILICAKDGIFHFHENEIKFPKDIYIGNKVFISSEVSIFGPCIVCDNSFIGYGSTLINTNVGKNCVIEEGVTLKNVSIPEETYIPKKSVIDSKEKLNQIIENNRLLTTTEENLLDAMAS